MNPKKKARIVGGYLTTEATERLLGEVETL